MLSQTACYMTSPNTTTWRGFPGRCRWRWCAKSVRLAAIDPSRWRSYLTSLPYRAYRIADSLWLAAFVASDSVSGEGGVLCEAEICVTPRPRRRAGLCYGGFLHTRHSWSTLEGGVWLGMCGRSVFR